MELDATHAKTLAPGFSSGQSLATKCMAQKAPSSSLCLFKETRIDLEPKNSGSVIQIQLPSPSAFSRSSRSRRLVLKSLPSYKDEKAFSRGCLASLSSIFFGQSREYPRSFLWRILEDNKVLELRSVDLVKSDRDSKAATHVIRFSFPSAIRPDCVALAETEDQDVFSVFVLTKGNDLFTLSLRRDFFCRAASSEEEVEKWCKVFRPPSFSLSTPHRLIAGSSLLLVIALSDGRLLRLTRGKEGDGSNWRETTYNDGQWGSSLRGLVRWQGTNTMRYDGNILDQSTAISLKLSPDKKHVYCVCLNHTLKVWNLEGTKTTPYATDLLGLQREPHEIPKVMIDPGSSKVLQVFETEPLVEGDQYYSITFSPHDLGQFKIWAIRDADQGNRGIRDLFPEVTLRPPDPDPTPDSKAIWKVADFQLKGEGNTNGLEMWVLMRSNKRYKLYNIKFDLQDIANAVWRDHWSTTASEIFYRDPQPQPSDLEPEDVTEQWLDFILRPGKSPEVILETALSMYAAARKADISSNAKASLKERMCSAISSSVKLVRNEAGALDFEGYRAALHREWTIYHQEIQDLDSSQWDILSLTYGDHADMPWLLFADGCSAIRDSSKIEIMSQNKHGDLAKSMQLLETPSIEADSDGMEPKFPDELSVILEAAAALRQSFSHSLRQTCERVLAAELWQDPSYSVPVRIQSFYDQCNFSNKISDNAFDDLLATLNPLGGFSGLETNSFKAILNEIDLMMSTEESDLLSTDFGLKVLVKGAQEMVDLHERILVDLLVLVVFVEMDVDPEETPMDDFDAAEIYLELLEQLKRYQMMQWLGKNTRTEPRSRGETSSPTSVVGEFPASSDEDRMSTVLENLFAVDLKPQSYDLQPPSAALTHTIQDLLQWVNGGNDISISLNSVLVHVQCNLLVNRNIDLASYFLRYQPSTAWSTYVKGRLYLIRNEFTEAAIYFKKAAYNLCTTLSPRSPEKSLTTTTPARPTSTFDYSSASSSLLSPTEAAFFSTGLPAYYAHIATLFQPSCPSQTASFSHLGLQLLQPSSPQRPSILTTLFHASLSTSSFQEAFSALTLLPPSTQSSLLPHLLASLLIHSPSTLLSLPFPPLLIPQIDSFLTHRSSQPSLSSSSSKDAAPLLASFRLNHHDFRGAAAALWQHLQCARDNKTARANLGDRGIEECYLAIINLLACAGEDEAWLFSGGDEGDGAGAGGGGGGGGSGGGIVAGGSGKAGKKRTVITLADVRKSWQAELETRSVVEGGKWGFGFDEEMVDV